jgi:hypothetical protein
LEPVGFWSSRLGALDPLLDAIPSTDAYDDLLRLKISEKAKFAKEFAVYLLREDELFARAYAQFIAQRSGDDKMRAYLDDILSSDDPLVRSAQGKKDDFEPVYGTFEALLRDRNLAR